jgi:uncharacterized protein YecE (DUF72 family)
MWTAEEHDRERKLEQLAAPILEVAHEARETHLLMNNCYRDYAVRNAADLRELIAGRVNA